MSRKHHADKLEPSKPDHIQLPLVVKEKMQELVTLQRRTRGTELQIPAHMQQDILRFRTLLKRHKELDFRHKQSEIESVKALAEWTLTVNAALRNQDKVKVPEWTI